MQTVQVLPEQIRQLLTPAPGQLELQVVELVRENPLTQAEHVETVAQVEQYATEQNATLQVVTPPDVAKL